MTKDNENKNIENFEEDELVNASSLAHEEYLNDTENVRWLPVAFFIGAALSLIMGLFKLWVYVSPDSYKDPVNVYVGGDGYNFIINGTHATSYFTLFGALLVAGYLAEMLHLLKEKLK